MKLLLDTHCLIWALTDAPALAKGKDAPLVFAHGNPRVTVDSMNGMKRELPWNTDREGFRKVDDEDWINETLFRWFARRPSPRCFRQTAGGGHSHRII